MAFKQKQVRRKPKTPKPRKSFKRNPPGGGGVLTRYQITQIERVYKSVPHEELIEALQHSADPRADRLLEIMADSAYAQHSFALKCKAASMPPAEVWRIVIDLHKLDGEIRVARRIPRIMEAMAVDAMPHTVECMQCRGTGIGKPKKPSADAMPEDSIAEPCVKCFGQGKMLIPADPEARKQALESAGILGQRGPLIDARSIHMGGGGAQGFQAPDMSEWSRSTDDAFEERGAYSKADTAASVIDVTPSEGESNA